MIYHEYNLDKPQTLLLVHPLFLQGDDFLARLEPLQHKYHIIAPDITAHGEDCSQFENLQAEGEHLYALLRENDIKKIDFVLGTSLGARVSLSCLHRIIAGQDEYPLEIQHILLDSMPIHMTWLHYNLSCLFLRYFRWRGQSKPELVKNKLTKM